MQISQPESYWTYEICHGHYVRQYHEEREGKKVKLQEYILGRWDTALTKLLRMYYILLILFFVVLVLHAIILFS